MRTQALADLHCATLKGVGSERIERDQGRRAGDRVAAVGAAQAAGVGGVHDLGAAGHRRQRHAGGDRFAADQQIGHQIVVLNRKQLAGAAHAGLHLVGDIEHAVLGAARAQVRGKARRQGQEAALALHGFDHHGGHGVRRHLGDQRMVELFDAVVDVNLFAHPGGAAVEVGKGKTVDLGREGAEAALEQRIFAGHAEGHVAAPVIGALEHNERLPAGVGAGDLHRRLDRFGAAVEQRGFLGKIAGHQRIQALAHLNVGRIGGDDGAHVNELFGLCPDGIHHLARAVADCQRADAAGKVDIGVAIHIGDGRALAAGHGNAGEAGGAARDGGVATGDDGLAVGAGDFGFQHNR